MISLFDGIYPDKRLVSSSQIQIMLKLFQQDLMNGLVEISYSQTEKVLLLLSRGKITCAYDCHGDTITRHPIPDLYMLFNSHTQGHIRICEFAPSFLRAVKTIVEQPHSLNTFSSSTSELPAVIQKQQALPEPSLLHIRWPRAEGFVFLPGNNFSPRQYAFISEGQSSDLAAAVSMFSRWSETQCTISQFAADPEKEIWKENSLQIGFSLLIEQILRRHEELVGHLLSRKLEDNLNSLSNTQSWNISIASSAVDDVQLFDSIGDAIAAYRIILDLASRQITSVIGLRLYNETIESSMDSLGGQLRRALEINSLVTAAPGPDKG